MPQLINDPRIKSAMADPRFLSLSDEDKKGTLSALLRKIDTESKSNVVSFKPSTTTKFVPKELLAAIEKQKALEGPLGHITTKVGPLLNASQVEPLVAGAAGGMAGYATAQTGIGLPVSGLVGSGTMAAVQALFDAAHNKSASQPISELTEDKGGTDLTNRLIGVGENTVVNESLGQVISGIGGKLKGIVKESDLVKGGSIQKVIAKMRDKFTSIRGGAGTISGPLSRLEPTYSHYPETSKLSKLVEDLGAPESKQKSIERTSKLIEQDANDFVSNLTGSKLGINDIEQQALKIKGQTKVSFEQTAKVEASKYAEVLKEGENPLNSTISTIELTPARIEQVPTLMVNPDGSPIMRTVNIPATYKNIQIKGPVSPTNLIHAAEDLKLKIEQSSGSPESNSGILRDLNSIIEKRSQVDSKGNLIPMEFKDAWQDKKDFALKGDFGANRQDITGQDIRYRELSKAIDQDIQESIPNWRAAPKDTLLKFKQGNTIVARKYRIFDPGHESGLSSKDLLNSSTIPDPAVDAILNDSKKLARSVVTGDLRIKGVQVSTTGIKKDWQGYAFMKLFQDAKVPIDPANATKGTTFNPFKLMSNTTEFLNSKSGKQLFNSTERSNVSQLMKEYTMALQKVDTSGGRYVKLMMGRNAAYLTGAMIAGRLGPTSATGAAILGAGISFHGLAKLMTNTNSARLMIAMVRGAPLNMSTQMAGRVITSVLRNELLTLDNSDGTQTSARVNNNNQIEEIR